MYFKNNSLKIQLSIAVFKEDSKLPDLDLVKTDVDGQHLLRGSRKCIQLSVRIQLVKIYSPIYCYHLFISSGLSLCRRDTCVVENVRLQYSYIMQVHVTMLQVLTWRRYHVTSRKKQKFETTLSPS